MSVLITASTQFLNATSDTTYAYPQTMACWIRKPGGHPNATRCVFVGAASLGTGTHYHQINFTANAGTDRMSSSASGATSNSTSGDGADGMFADVWVPLVHVLPGVISTTIDADRKLYFGTPSTFTADGSVRTSVNAVGSGTAPHFRMAANITGSGGIGSEDTYLAEWAFWDTELTTQQYTDYMNGVVATAIAPSNLRFYFSFRNDLTQTGGLATITPTWNAGAGTFDNTNHPSVHGTNPITIFTNQYNRRRAA